jgi:heme-degrading monooxygenase HmoA
MFARNVSVRLKPNTLAQFTTTLNNDVMVILKKQPGFRDEIAFSSDDELHVTAISLWDTKEQAETYNTSAYPQVLKSMEKFTDGEPKVRVNRVLSSTLHKLTAVAA